MKLPLFALLAALAAGTSSAENLNSAILAGQDPLSRQILTQSMKPDGGVTAYGLTPQGRMIKLQNLDIQSVSGLTSVALSPSGNIRSGLSPAPGLRAKKTASAATNRAKIRKASRQLRHIEKNPKETWL